MGEIYSEALEEEIKQKSTQLERLKKVKEKFPDAHICRHKGMIKGFDHWWFEADINSAATAFNTSDLYQESDMIYIIPYVEMGEETIHSSEEIYLGERDFEDGIRVDINWKANLIEAGVSETVIEQVKQYILNDKREALLHHLEAAERIKESIEYCIKLTC